MLYKDHEIDFFHPLQKFIFFALFNFVLYTIAISVFHDIATKALYFGLFLFSGVSISYLLSRRPNTFKVWFIYPLYLVIYGIFAGIGLLPFNIGLIAAIVILFHIQIKIYPYIFLEKQETLFDIWQYACLNDFDNSMSLHKYGIPIAQDDKDVRLIDEELKLMRAYNKILFFKNKITEKNFGEIGNLYFYVPKSLSLVVYQTIVNYCELGIVSQSSNPIIIKVRDYSQQQFNPARGDYMIEFQVDQSILKSITSNTGEISVLSDAINEIANVCQHKGIGVYGIDYGVSGPDKKTFIIRIKYKKTEQVDLKLIDALNNPRFMPSNNFMSGKGTQYENMKL